MNLLIIYKAAVKLSQVCYLCVRLHTHVCVRLQQVNVRLQHMDVCLHTQVGVSLQLVNVCPLHMDVSLHTPRRRRRGCGLDGVIYVSQR